MRFKVPQFKEVTRFPPFHKNCNGKGFWLNAGSLAALKNYICCIWRLM